MTRISLTITLVAAAALAGCKNSDHTIVQSQPGDDSNAVANANVQLPPPIAASKIYRCADNKVVYVDWLADNKTANIRTDPSGTPTQVTTAEPGKPMTGPNGYQLSGGPTDATAKIAIPGHPSQSCKA
ncbi:MAG: hypothetical protein ABI454_04360 [Sphingomicrobium sp.]